MRPFFSEIVQYNLNTSNFGLRLRVTGGTLLSTVDLVTDIYMTVQFFNTDGQERYGRTNAWLIGLTMFWQIFVSYCQNRKLPSLFFQDAFFTFIGFKPALDTYRVGSGAEQEDHQLMNPLLEMTYTKVIETVFEAIPVRSATHGDRSGLVDLLLGVRHGALFTIEDFARRFLLLPQRLWCY